MHVRDHRLDIEIEVGPKLQGLIEKLIVALTPTVDIPQEIADLRKATANLKAADDAAAAAIPPNP